MLIAGRYRLQDVVGRGAVGEVWRAFDESLGRPVAVKLLLPQGSDPSAASRFRLEAQTAGCLNHPHVVGVLDFGEHEDRLFLVMELVEGDSLARLAGSGPLLAEHVALIAAQAAAGLAAAHRQNIVHRDIKPANLLLDTHGALKIGDFGIARFVDDPGAALTATGQIVGTSLYLAPERALGRPAGPASDVYALGCVLYQLLTGRPPFQADTALAILHQHLDASPAPPRQLGTSLPPAFESYLLGLLAKQPEDRPTADQAADWFGRGAWRGAPEPLPQELPNQGRRPAPSAVRGPHITGPGTAVPGTPIPGTAVPAPSVGSVGGVSVRAAETEWKTTVHRAAPHRPRLPLSRRSRLVALLGGAALFSVALLAGLTWFSPDTGTAQVPQAEPSALVNPSLSPSPASSGTAPSSSPTPSPSSSAAQTADRKTAAPADPNKSPKAAGKHGGKGKH
ncbi:serine/threonine protein kinase [Streptomyces sp. SceaMP-e96]|uniref:serine/threonine-protein kinase n=1 Tax=unclassified Streptomyces TaxID=2593676 RepID=UPI000823C340|nr:serine/threonine-protein kinase [Streptomyces sp. SceaMP-e96]MYT18135.1 protein kinase [Streptomyces sp. SID4951]SCK51249.1 serine/threonine protein kinase [Streptomyces sp. SceaMP-e96]